MAALSFEKRVGRRRKKGVSFNPNKEFLDGAVEEYIKNGGKITKLEYVPHERSNIYRPYRSPAVIDLSILD